LLQVKIDIRILKGQRRLVEMGAGSILTSELPILLFSKSQANGDVIISEVLNNSNTIIGKGFCKGLEKNPHQKT
jgi:hypothetical protein